MENVNATIPYETAIIPIEEARQCSIGDTGEFDLQRTVINPKSSNASKKGHKQRSASEMLSQPFGLRHRERLLWLQKRRKTGLWAQCDTCDRWRYLPHVLDRHELPTKWYCNLNPDKTLGDCSLPEVPIDLHEEEDLIHSEFAAGSVVWARLAGWPWWPALVDDCPDTEQFYWLDGFSDIPTFYNVTFFDKSEVTRAWISKEKIKPFSSNKKIAERVLKIDKYEKRLTAAIKQAEDALKLPLPSRLEKYSFLARYKGNISTPTKLSKTVIEKYRKHLKRKLNIDFSSDSSDTENDSPVKEKSKTNDKSYTATPKKVKAKTVKPKRILNDVNTNSTSVTTNTMVDSTTLINTTLDVTNDKDTSSTVTQNLFTIREENEIHSTNERPSSNASGDFDY